MLYQAKSNLDIDDLCMGLPKQMKTYIEYVRALQFEQQPDYEYLCSLFDEIMDSKNNGPTFEWLAEDEFYKFVGNSLTRSEGIRLFNQYTDANQSNTLSRLS